MLQKSEHEGATEAKLRAEAAADAALSDLLKPHERARVEDGALRLHEISTLLIQESNLDCPYNRILDAAIGLMSADMASMQIFYPKQCELQLLAYRGFHQNQLPFGNGFISILPAAVDWHCRRNAAS